MEMLFKAAWPRIVTFGEPGVQGAVTTGKQAAGVKTPSLAAVAAATAGLVIVLHSGKGGIFFIGAKSITVAGANPLVSTIFSAVTTSVPGPRPKLHWIIAPL
jgi:ABC-type Co2+ transport system permease subunit